MEQISQKEIELALQKITKEELEEKLSQNYPIQYIIGNVEFLNTIINVDERVLIPRYETELLVDKTIKRIKEKNLKILELGTGSGCIAIALKKNIDCDITSIDISKDCIELAQENANINNTEINFKCNDMLEESYECFDIIISNPPYVGEKESVSIETKYEPQNALFAKKNGLFFYEEILKKVSKENPSIKLIVFEIGMNQGDSLKELTEKYLNNYICEIEKDLTNRDRFAFITPKSE